MAIIKVKSLDDISLPNKPVRQGNNGYIFAYHEKYFKLLSLIYMNLDDKDNLRRLDILKKLSELKGTKYLVLPEDIYITEEQVLGYTMKIYPGKEFTFLLDSDSYDILVEAVARLLKEIRILSNLGILDLDICSSNILYDKYNLYLLDFDSSIMYGDKEEAYRLMGASLISLVLGKILDIENLELFYDIDINYMKREIDCLRSTNYMGLLGLLRLKTERILKREVRNIGDIRRVLKKDND